MLPVFITVSVVVSFMCVVFFNLHNHLKYISILGNEEEVHMTGERQSQKPDSQGFWNVFQGTFHYVILAFH